MIFIVVALICSAVLLIFALCVYVYLFGTGRFFFYCAWVLCWGEINLYFAIWSFRFALLHIIFLDLLKLRLKACWVWFAGGLRGRWWVSVGDLSRLIVLYESGLCLLCSPVILDLFPYRTCFLLHRLCRNLPDCFGIIAGSVYLIGCSCDWTFRKPGNLGV